MDGRRHDPSIPSTPSLAPGNEAAGLDALAAACAAFTGTPAGPGFPAVPPNGATSEPAPDFAQLMMPRVTPAGDATLLPTAVPPPAGQIAPGSATRLKLAAATPSGADPLTREQLEAAAAMLAPATPMTTLPPPAAEPTLSPASAAIAPVATPHAADPNPPRPPTPAAPPPAAALRATTTGIGPSLTVSDPPAATPLPAASPTTFAGEIPASPAGNMAGQEFNSPDDTAALPAAAATAPVVLPQPDLSPTDGARISGVAKNAASPVLLANPATETNSSTIKKILSVEDADDAEPQANVGITVAKPDPVMATHLPERPTVADLVVQSFVPGNRPEASAPLADIREHRPAVIAQRAVEAVVQVVETQAAARLQPAPGVQLHLKLGGEDIAIRVELREGNVHTQFRTDSNEVRQAIAHEWSILRAESPERTLRYLEPEFSADRPASSPGSDGRQGAASHQQSRAPQPDIFGAIGRSYPYHRTEADSPVREIAARLLPTSVHLSALA
ncbi:MAG: hypothetical protein PSV13_02315 [Lacunisphaera sp.]|nr:hypothetical protein [Lacunisphaera sp.]